MPLLMGGGGGFANYQTHTVQLDGAQLAAHYKTAPDEQCNKYQRANANESLFFCSPVSETNMNCSSLLLVRGNREWNEMGKMADGGGKGSDKGKGFMRKQPAEGSDFFFCRKKNDGIQSFLFLSIYFFLRLSANAQACLSLLSFTPSVPSPPSPSHCSSPICHRKLKFYVWASQKAGPYCASRFRGVSTA